MSGFGVEEEGRVAHLLRRARTTAGLSLRDLAARAGTSHATLLAYERGRKVPGVVTLLRILDAAGYALDFELSPRIRERDGIRRGDELVAALDLAAQFPARHARRIEFPKLTRQ